MRVVSLFAFGRLYLLGVRVRLPSLPYVLCAATQAAEAAQACIDVPLLMRCLHGELGTGDGVGLVHSLRGQGRLCYGLGANQAAVRALHAEPHRLVCIDSKSTLLARLFRKRVEVEVSGLGRWLVSCKGQG